MSGTVTIDITHSFILNAVRQFLLLILPAGTEVVRGQANRVPEPTSPNYVVMTPLFGERLSTTVDTYQDNITSGFRFAQVSMDLTIQLDFHGPSSGDNSQVFVALWRDEYGSTVIFENALIIAEVQTDAGDNIQTNTGADIDITNQFNIVPLYSSDPRQAPFINGEAQYEYRWSVDAHLQFSPTVTLTQQFAAKLGPIGIKQVDATYPPT